MSVAAVPLEEIGDLSNDAGREAFFGCRTELCTEWVVWELLAESRHQLRVDLDRAGRLADSCCWLASRLAAPVLGALGTRARANATHLRGDHREAQRLYEAAMAALESLGESLQAAVTRSSALVNLAYLGDYDRVTEWATAARRTFVDLGDRVRLATLDGNEAGILFRRDHWPEALELYLSAYETLKDTDQQELVILILRNVATCRTNLLHFPEALEAYRGARAACVREGLDRVRDEVDHNIAYLHYLRGDYDRAIRLFHEVRLRCEAAGDSYHLALCDLDLSEIYLEINLIAEAAALAADAIRGFENLEMPYELGKAIVLRAQADGRRWRTRSALDGLSRAREIFDGEANELWIGRVDLHRAALELLLGRHASALECVDRALTRFAREELVAQRAAGELLRSRVLFLEGELDEARAGCGRAVELADELGLPALVFRGLLLRARIDESCGRRSAAREDYQNACDLLERLRYRLHREDLRISFLDDKQEAFEGLVVLSLQDGDHQRAFELIEKAKSRELSDLLRASPATADEPAAVASELEARISDRLEELNRLYRQIDLRQFRARRAHSAVSELQGVARSKERELRSLLRQRDASGPTSRRRSRSGAPDGVTSLPADSQLLELYVARGRIFAGLVSASGVEFREVAGVEEVASVRRRLRFQLSRVGDVDRRGSAGTKRAGRAVDHHLRTLYDLLVRPWRERLSAASLIVVPHGLLHDLPFHAFHDGERSLVETVAVSYSPSAEVLSLCRRRRPATGERSLVLGLPDEGAPHIEEEVRGIAERLPGPTVLIGRQATEEALRREGPRCRFLHIASHGHFRADNPLFSALQLADSRLTLLGMAELDLDVELAVLSGCSTGLSAVAGGDEALGLGRGLLAAGARSVLASLWDVDDRSTADFMARFYDHYRASGEAAASLRAVMLESKADCENSWVWAPFVLVGAPDSAGVYQTGPGAPLFK